MREKMIKLDKNESPFELPKILKKEILKSFLKIEWRRYPKEEVEVKELISDYSKFEPEGIAVGNGSNELIQAIFLGFLKKGKKVLIPEPCFPIYPWIASLLNLKIIQTPLDSEFRYDIDDLIKKAKKEKPSLIVLLSPHNPCGCEIPEDAFFKILELKDSHILIDEAYYEFSGKSFKDYLGNHKKLIILRTFSKAFSIAGLRAGYILGSPEIIKIVENSKPPFSVNSFTINALKLLLKNRDYVKRFVEKIKEEREKLFTDLRKIGSIKPFPSSGNFILFKINKEDSSKVYEEMKKRGILLRNFDSPRLRDCLRMTVGSEKENKKFIKELKEVFNEFKKH